MTYHYSTVPHAAPVKRRTVVLLVLVYAVLLEEVARLIIGG